MIAFNEEERMLILGCLCFAARLKKLSPLSASHFT